jgi:hypothetical protein
MENNLYAPPKSVVSDVTPTPYEANVHFFSVSPVKLVVLSIGTLGIYQIYWFYKQWVLIQKHSEPDIVPWGRAVFSILWCYSCFDSVRRDEEHLGLEHKLPAPLLAAGWIITSLCWRLPEPYSLCGLISHFLLIPVQLHINRINTLVVPEHDRNARFSAWNWLGAISGGIMLTLIVIGSMQLPHGG